MKVILLPSFAHIHPLPLGAIPTEGTTEYTAVSRACLDPAGYHQLLHHSWTSKQRALWYLAPLLPHLCLTVLMDIYLLPLWHSRHQLCSHFLLPSVRSLCFGSSLKEISCPTPIHLERKKGGKKKKNRYWELVIILIAKLQLHDKKSKKVLSTQSTHVWS